MIRELGLNEVVAPSKSLLSEKKKAYAALPPDTRTAKLKELEKEIIALRHGINEVHKKRFSLFKQLFHETIRKDWEKVILN